MLVALSILDSDAQNVTKLLLRTNRMREQFVIWDVSVKKSLDDSDHSIQPIPDMLDLEDKGDGSQGPFGHRGCTC